MEGPLLSDGQRLLHLLLLHRFASNQNIRAGFAAAAGFAGLAAFPSTAAATGAGRAGAGGSGGAPLFRKSTRNETGSCEC